MWNGGLYGIIRGGNVMAELLAVILLVGVGMAAYAWFTLPPRPRH